jgi:hypothetical protein
VPETRPRPEAARVLGLAEVTSRTTFLKCMGRTYTATATGNSVVALCDATDITRPVPLGTARQVAPDLWAVHSARGDELLHTADLLPALAALREAFTAPR